MQNETVSLAGADHTTCHTDKADDPEQGERCGDVLGKHGNLSLGGV